MRTPKQIEASRANGANSKGPLTPRRPAAPNRPRAEFSRYIVSEGESRHRFDRLHRTFEAQRARTRAMKSRATDEGSRRGSRSVLREIPKAELLTQTAMDRLLVARMTVAHSRTARVWAPEKAPVFQDHAPHAATDAPARRAQTVLRIGLRPPVFPRLHHFLKLRVSRAK